MFSGLFRSDITILTGTAFAILISFSISLKGGFVFDDVEAVVNNKDVTDNKTLSDIFSHDFWGSPIKSRTSHKSYRPITITIFRLNYLASGGLYPLHFHIINVLLHIINTVLIYKVVDRLCCLCACCSSISANGLSLSGMPVAALTSILFAVHPVHTECVAGIVGQAELLAALFYLLSLRIYLRVISTNDISTTPVVGLLLLCTVGCLCKEQAVTVLGVCGAVDYLILDFNHLLAIKQRLKNHQFIKRQVALVVIASAILYSRWLIMGNQLPTFQVVDNPHSFVDNYFLRVLNYLYVYSMNCLLLLCPVWLCFDWSMGCIPVLSSTLDPRVLAVLLPVVLGTSLVWWCGQGARTYSKRLVLVGGCLTVLPFLPASNVFFRVGFVLAERVLYLPSIGSCLIVAVAVTKNKRTYPGFLLLILLYAAKSYQRSSDWLDELTLFRSAESVCPLNAKVHYNIGKVLADQGNVEKAMEKYQLAIKLHPAYDQALNNLGNLYRDINQPVMAREYLLQAVQSNPKFAAGWMNLGIVQATLNDTVGSEESYLQALELRKKYPDCHYNLGNLYLSLGNYPKALSSWRQATLQKPNHISSWLNSIVLLDNLALYKEVEIVAHEALQFNPNEATLHYAYASAMGKAERHSVSEEHFLTAIRLQPDQADYYSNLAVLYHRMKRYQEAEELYLHGLRLAPDHDQMKANLQLLRNTISKTDT